MGKVDYRKPIVVVHPADEPQNGMNTFAITIDNLPWTIGKSTR